MPVFYDVDPSDNFAFGGTGVFDTGNFQPNLTTQIGYLQGLIKDSVYTKRDLESSLAMVTVSGNDYSAFTASGGSQQTNEINHAIGERTEVLQDATADLALPRTKSVHSVQRGREDVGFFSRDKVRDHVLWKIGDGTKVSAWNDRWDSLGHLSDTISSRDIHEAGLTMESTLAELVLKGCLEQGLLWSYYGAKMEWYPVIWYNMSIPKHTFVVWMALQNKLMTQENIAKWKDDDGMKCSLCQCCMDSIEHLFFMCPYTNAVWGEIQKMLNVQLSYVWHIIVDELIGLPNNKNVWSIVRRLVFGAAVYFIWQERNRRMFQNEKREVKNVVEIIKETVRLKLASFVVKNGRTVRNVEAVWGIKFYRKV
ncbi:RNA-directed DNA polymerase, eukaryota, reverse transcriptase zinc-binding domain protein [Tanacetum coccineum]